MADFRGDENHAARENFFVFGSGLETGASAKHVIDFIFAMRLLMIRCSSRQNIKTGAHRGHSYKFAVGPATFGALLFDGVESSQECLHAKMPPKIRSVNCGI